MKENLIAQNYARAFLDKKQNPQIGENLYKEICKIKKKIDTHNQLKITFYKKNIPTKKTISVYDTLIKQNHYSQFTHVFFTLL